MRVVRAAMLLGVVALGAGAVALAVEQPQRGERDEEPETVSSFSGALTADGRGYRLGNRELGLGPPWWRETAKTVDYDGDGRIETIAVELAGLRGQSVSVTAATEDGDDDASVRTLAGKPYRAAGKPPWAGGRKGKDKGAAKGSKCEAKSERKGGPPPWAKAHGRRCA